MSGVLMGPRMNAIVIQWPSDPKAQFEGIKVTTNLGNDKDIATALRITLSAIRREIRAAEAQGGEGAG